MSDSLEQTQQEAAEAEPVATDTRPKAETVTTDTRPVSLSGYPLTQTDERMIRRGVEQELRVRQALAAMRPNEPEPVTPDEPADDTPDTPTGPVGIVDQSEPKKTEKQNVLYKRRAHVFQVVSHLGLFVKTIIFVFLGLALYAWFKFAPPYMPPPPIEEQGTSSYERNLIMSELGNTVIEIVRAILEGIEPFLPWALPLVLLITFAISAKRGFQGLLLWLFTYLIVTETHIAIIVRLPKGKLFQLFYAALKITPYSTSIPRNMIGTPEFDQGFWGIVFNYGEATFESAVQFDQAFRNIGFIAGFKKFQRILDTLSDLAID